METFSKNQFSECLRSGWGNNYAAVSVPKSVLIMLFSYLFSGKHDVFKSIICMGMWLEHVLKRVHCSVSTNIFNKASLKVIIFSTGLNFEHMKNEANIDLKST